MGMNTDAVQRLYVAYFNRPADPVSLAVYEAMLPSDRAATYEELLAIADQYFSPSAEYSALYAGMSNSQVVNALYQNLFGRDAEPAGLLAWSELLQNGSETIASIALQLTFAAQGTDADSIAGKIKAANAFTTEVATDTANITGYSGNDAAASARSWLATVTDDASADAAIAGVEAAVAAAISADSTPVPPVATFALTSDVAASDEGTTVYFTLATTNVAEGATYSYTLSGTNITNGDVDGSLAGTATIDASGNAVIAVDFTNDQLTEGLETITMTVAGQTASVNINDTSTTPAEATPTYSLSASNGTVGEGDTVVFTMTTTNVASGSQLAWSLTGVTSADVVGGALTGMATVGSNGIAIVSVSLTNDADSEGVETMTMSMAGQTAAVVINDTSGDAAGTFILTTGADGGAAFTGESANDIFSGAVGTLNTVDTLDGGDGTGDTVNAVMSGAATPTLQNIELMTITATGVSTVDLLNADSLTSINSSSSTAALTFSNVEVGDAVSILNTNQNHTLNYEGDTGTTDTVAITMNGVTGAADLVVDAAIETVNMTSEGTNSFETDFAGTIDLAGSGALTLAGTGAGTVAASVLDAGDYTGALTVSMTDAAHTVTGGSAGDAITGATGTANTLTGNGGNDTITGGTGADSISGGEGNNQITTNAGADTVTAGTGNDTITHSGVTGASIAAGDGNNTVTAGTGADSITAGAGSDRIIFTTDGALTVDDTVNPGTGTDTLVATAGAVNTNAGLGAALDLETLQTGFANFQILEVSDAMAAGETIDTAKIGSGIGRVDLTTTGVGANNFIFNAGPTTLNLNMAGAAFAGAVALTDTGTATTDSVTIVNNNVANANRFGNQNLTVNGFETLVLDGGTTAVATTQQVGTIAMNPDGATTASVITLVGANEMNIGAVTQAGTGLLTISGATVTAQAAGATLTIAAPVVTTGGASIVGSAGNDDITGDINNVNTITGGGGQDTIVGGSAADSLTGGDGIDAITSGGGNDTISSAGGADTITGGAGNESITTGAGADQITTAAGNDSVNAGGDNDRVIAAGNLTTDDTLDGGDGTDTLVITTAVTAASALNLSNFETIEYTAGGAISQDMFLFGSDNTISTVVLAGSENLVLTNVASTTNSIVIAATLNDDDITATRLVDTSSDTLTVSIQTGTDAAQDLGELNIANTESLTLNTTMDTAGRVFDISTDIDAADMTSLTITGNSNVDINAITSATGLATINATGLSGTLVIGDLAAVVTADMTVTTGAGNSTILSGTGDDTITGGDGADRFTGNGGADVLNGAGGADSLSGGAGADALNGGAAADSMLGGAGADTLTGGDGADVFQLAASTDGTDSFADWTDGDDIFSIANAIINPAATADGAALAAADYEQSRNTIADIVVGDTLHVIELQQAQSTAQIQTVAAGGAANAVVIVFNSDTGKAEIWYDSDWSDAAGRVKLATVDSLTQLSDVTDLTEADWVNGG